MIRRLFNWQVVFGIILILLSAIVYFVHFLIFKDAHHIFIYLIGDIAFVFIEVLLVTLVFHQLLHYREKKALLNKLNMVIGTFFSEAGTELLSLFASFDKEPYKIKDKLARVELWSGRDFYKILKEVSSHDCLLDSKKGDLEKLKSFLKEKRQFFLNLLENQNLLEHESFTNLLWAVFHLTEELTHRKKCFGLADSDYKHLTGDIKRVYHLLIIEWMNYMKHLQNNYPYLFSLALRTNPFDPNASVEIKQ